MVHFHRFAINEASRRPEKGVLIHWRDFLTIRRFEDGPQLFGGHLEAILRSPKPEFSARFSVGTASSETPFDGHLTILGSGLYWGIENGGKLADFLTRRDVHKYEGRELKLHLYHGTLYWHVWTHSGSWERGEFAAWRTGSQNVRPLDILFGRRRYWYEDVDTAELEIQMPEGAYPVKATLQRQLHGRPKSKRRETSWTVDVEAPKGIPNRYDKSGGWKGDRVYGFGVKLAQRRQDWFVDAKAAIEARILKDRANSGFREPQPVGE